MKVGKYTYGVNPQKHIRLEGGGVTIGSFCSFAGGLKMITGKGSHRTEFVSTFPFGFIHEKTFPSDPKNLLLDDPGDVVIGNDVWAGENVTIMPGVSIGDGVVIANNSHVVKNVEPYSIVGGNPAKHIKFRFDEETIKKLLKIKWWTWDDEKIKDNLQYITSSNISEFVDKFYDEN
jgi:acetyltransferase-like isoleucine patch superfamily enzyme